MSNQIVNIIPFYKKLNKYEISCVLFDRCNLKCKFCFEEGMRDNSIDLDYIKSIPDVLFENFQKEVKAHQLSISFVNIMFWGGELFFDGLKDDVFECYYYLIDTLMDRFSVYPTIQLQFSWLSNGVFTKRDRVEKLMQYHPNCVLGFSYDPVHRFSSKKQKTIMLDNASYFVSKGICDKISITLTKPNIKAFLNDNSDLVFFKDLGVDVDVNYYIANPNWTYYQPDDELIYHFYKMCIDNRLFNVVTLEKCFWVFLNTRVDKHCDCNQCSQITKGLWSTDCAKRSSCLPKDLFYGKLTCCIDESNSNEVKATLGIQKRGCLLCKYYKRCQMPCWISVIFQHYQTTQCPYYRITQLIENDPNLLKQYIEDRKSIRLSDIQL